MLENPKINIKLKLSALWATLMSLYIYGDYFELYAPKKVEKLINGTAILDSPIKLFLASLMLAIPSAMIALSLLLKPKINRILNMVFGMLFSVLVLMVISTAIYTWYAFYVFYGILEVIITILIVWFAWNWPKKASF